VEIREGLQDPEYRTAIRLTHGNNTLQWLHAELQEIEADTRALWQKTNNVCKPSPLRGRLNLRQRGYRGYRGQIRGTLANVVPARQGPARETLAITATEAKVPPRPCRYCGGTHWDRECRHFGQPVSAFHYYSPDTSQEEYEEAEHSYEQMQTSVYFAINSVASGNQEDDEYLQDQNEPDEFDGPEYDEPSSKWLAPITASKTASPLVSDAETSPTFAWFTRPEKPKQCRLCLQEFTSRNLLYKHLDQTKHFIHKKETTKDMRHKAEIIQSKAIDSKVGSGHAFRDYNYCEIKYLLDPEGEARTACLDTGSGMSMIDNSELQRRGTWTDRISLKNPLKIRGIGSAIHDSWETVVIPLYLPNESNTKLASLTREFHVVNDLDCGLLIGTDIIEPEKMTIELHRRVVKIGSCNDMTCSLKVTPKNKISEHTVRSASTVTIQPGSSLAIPVRFKTLKADQDYIFAPYPNHMYLPEYTYVMRAIVRSDQEYIMVTNVDDKPATIKKGARVGHISSLQNPQPRHWPEASRDVNAYFTGASYMSSHPHMTKLVSTESTQFDPYAYVSSRPHMTSHPHMSSKSASTESTQFDPYAYVSSRPHMTSHPHMSSKSASTESMQYDEPRKKSWGQKIKAVFQKGTPEPEPAERKLMSKSQVLMPSRSMCTMTLHRNRFDRFEMYSPDFLAFFPTNSASRKSLKKTG
jgi:hypothetical protein